jgi:hypothetical protein
MFVQMGCFYTYPFRRKICLNSGNVLILLRNSNIPNVCENKDHYTKKSIWNVPAPMKPFCSIESLILNMEFRFHCIDYIVYWLFRYEVNTRIYIFWINILILFSWQAEEILQ